MEITRLESKHLSDDTVHCVVRTAPDQVTVSRQVDTTWNRTLYTFEGPASAIKAWCEDHYLYYLERPSPVLGRVEDGGRDANWVDHPYFVQWHVEAQDMRQAEVFIDQIVDQLGAKCYTYKGQTDVDNPAYPDHRTLFVFDVLNDVDYDWAKMPTNRIAQHY